MKFVCTIGIQKPTVMKPRVRDSDEEPGIKAIGCGTRILGDPGLRKIDVVPLSPAVYLIVTDSCLGGAIGVCGRPIIRG